MRKIGKAIRFILGVLFLAALIGPVAAVDVGCVIHIHKWMDANSDNIIDAGEMNTPAQNGFAFKAIVSSPTAKCRNKDDISDSEEFTAGSSGTAYISYSDLSCAITAEVITITEDVLNSPPGWSSATAPIVYACVKNGEVDYVWRDVPVEQPPVVVVPEFPTVAVSFATLVALGFVIYTFRYRD